jgi:ABC-type multidrug transport system ATPase subunit
MIAPIITFTKVSKRYKKKYALENIDLDIVPAEITGIIGPDGAGKSSLLKICSGVLRFDGSATFMGKDLQRDPESIKGHLSFMPQGLGLNLYMDLSVDENIDFFAAIKNVADEKRDRLKDRLLDITGLTPFRERFARNLSGGMKQKLGICCSLISEPDVLLLDEPSTGVDPLSRRQLWELLNGFISEAGTTLILATSYMDEAERCHSVKFLQGGKILFSGHPEHLMEGGKDLEEAFFDMLLEGKTPPEYEVPVSPSSPKHFSGGVTIEGVTKSFDAFRAVDNATLSISQGEIFGFLGPNGAGKTTLLKCILSLLKPDAGTITVLGMKAGNPELKQAIGYMSQVFSLYGDLTVRENMELYGSLYGVDREVFRERTRWVMGVANLGGREDALVGKLPLGMKQRLALGCATLNLPSLLVLDEPTSGVDPVARRSFWQLIRGLSGKLNMTILVTTHNLVEADYCDRIAIMNEGKIIAVDTPDNLRKDFVGASGEVYEFYPGSPVDTGIFTSRQISITPFGRRYHVWKKGLKEQELGALLDSAGIGYRFIRGIRPPMEDVFIHFLGRKP